MTRCDASVREPNSPTDPDIAPLALALIHRVYPMPVSVRNEHILGLLDGNDWPSPFPKANRGYRLNFCAPPTLGGNSVEG
jgi:hypothetical protein